MYRFALLTITRECINKGNLIIEYAARKAMGIEDFAVEVNAHAELNDHDVEAVNRCRALVLPGATLLEPGDHQAVEGLHRIKVPTLAIGVSLRSNGFSTNLRVARRIRGTIGSRDPFTHDALRLAGIPSRLVGCPVLMLGCAGEFSARTGPIVFSMGLGNQKILQECALACAQVDRTVLLLHAPGRQPLSPEVANLSSQPLDDAVRALNLIRAASVVVTSRIHSLLPAIAFGVPAIFVGGFYDSRYSLVEYLGVPIEPPLPLRIRGLAASACEGKFPPSLCFDRARILRENLVAWLDDTGGPLGLSTRQQGIA